MTISAVWRGRGAVWLVLALGYVVTLYWGFPGHLNADSLVTLYEGRQRVRVSFHPAFYSWLLGVLDWGTPGTAAYVLVSPLLLLGAWGALAALRPRASWIAPAAALLLIALPQVVAYQAIVWKDVLFANVSVLGFTLLAFGLRAQTTPRRWAWLAPAALLLAAAALLRQNGLILALPAAVAIVWALWAAGRRRAVATGLGWLALTLATTVLLHGAARPQGAWKPDTAESVGLRVLQHFDLVGAAAKDPSRPLPQIRNVDPAAEHEIRARALGAYSPQRVEAMDERLSPTLWTLPEDVVRAEWLHLIVRHPHLYVQTRLDVFRWTFASPDVYRCLPVTVGVDGAPAMLDRLGLAAGQDAKDRRLYNYVTWFTDTPALSHVAYAVLALVVGALLLIRREPADLAMVGLLAGALLFAASFFVISVACDYRYLYLLDVAALTGLLYLALDPRLASRRQA